MYAGGIVAGALGMATTASSSRTPGGGTAHEGIVELYHYPDGWWVGRIIDPLKLANVIHQNSLNTRTFLETPDTSQWFVLVDGTENYRSVISFRPGDDRSLWKRIASTHSAAPRLEPATRFRDRWIPFFADMIYGEIPDVPRLGPMSLPIMLPSGLRDRLKRQDHEPVIQDLRAELSKISLDPSNPHLTPVIRREHREKRTQIRNRLIEQTRDVIDNIFGPFFNVEHDDDIDPYLQSYIQVDIKLVNLYDFIDISTTTVVAPWAMIATYTYGTSDEFRSDTLAGLWKAFTDYIEDHWNVTVIYEDEYDVWADSLTWGDADVDLDLYYLVGAPSPVMADLDSFKAWARAEGLL